MCVKSRPRDAIRSTAEGLEEDGAGCPPIASLVLRISFPPVVFGRIPGYLSACDRGSQRRSMASLRQAGDRVRPGSFFVWADATGGLPAAAYGATAARDRIT